MTTHLIGNKKIESTISLTKSNIFSNHLYLLTNPLLNKKIKIEAECDNGNINILFNRNKRIKTSTSTYTSTTFTITPTTTFSFSNDKKYKKTINKINKNIKNSIILINNKYKNELKEIYKKKKNIRNTYTINGGCWTMQGYNAYNIPTLDERYSFVAAFIQDNCKNQLDNFEVLKKNRIKI